MQAQNGSHNDGSHKWTYVFHEPARILVVDDDPILCEFASVYLSAPMVEVQTASSGQAALDLLKKSTFDAVVSDISMPGMDGFELVRQVRACETLRHLPIVMLTAREDIASIDRAYMVGATSFTTKPVNWRILSYQLRYVIRASKMQPVTPAPSDSRAVGKPVSDATQREFGAALKWIIDAASSITLSGNPAEQALHAREIVAAAERMQRQLDWRVLPNEAGLPEPIDSRLRAIETKIEERARRAV